MKQLFNGIYHNQTVLVTGHTGFKGSWLIYWLEQMGANVIGYSIDTLITPNHYDLIKSNVISIKGDIRDQKKLDETFEEYKPTIVFHLAAQALVRLSYEEPVETYEINVMGTLKVLEACRKSKSVRAIVAITSDKVYENKEWLWGYRENDAIGGYDPYSSSKGAVELLVASYRNSYFNTNDYGTKHHILLSSARAGNVIGGGDWGEDRLLSDIMRATSSGDKVEIRSPNAIRPWQHVLEPLSGYLQLGQKLLEEKISYGDAWNFGPSDYDNLSVIEVIELSKKYWDKIDCTIINEVERIHEAKLLQLDCNKAKILLSWHSVWSYTYTFKKTIEWYKSYYDNKKINTADDFENYIKDAKAKKLAWSIT